MDAATFDRITHNPAVMGGKACIRGMRVTVGMILAEVASGTSVAQLLADFPYLEEADISAALRYGAYLTEERELDLLNP